MILDSNQVINLAKSEVDSWIEIAREDSKKLKMHFYGTGTDEWLTKIDGLESSAQIKLRKDHAISNQWLTENLLRPIDAIWPAKGGVIKPDLPESTIKQFEEITNQIKPDYSIKKYLQGIWSDKFITDPNGLIFIEIDKEGDKAYPTQKGIEKIKNMKYSGLTPEYVCFEPDIVLDVQEKPTDKKTTKKYVWVVDDSFYYRVLVEDEATTIIEAISNSFNQVPGIANSSIVDTERKIFISPIERQIGLLDKYLTNNSVKEIYQFLHGYPVFWEYVQPCNTCKGTGKVGAENCTSCDGTGQSTKKDVSDQRKLKPPKNSDDPVIAPDIAGYVSPDIAAWQEQRTELDWTNNLLYFSLWGTTIERQDNETATGRFIDAQPVNNKLNSITDIIEVIHKKVLDLLGKFYYSETYKGSTVAYGRRFLIETPDQVWDKYLTAKKEKANVGALDQLLEQYYDSEYQNNELLRLYYLKLIKIEPFIHESVQEVDAMSIDQSKKNEKIFYSDWIKTIMINEVIDTQIDTLKTKLNEYANRGSSEEGQTS